LSYESTKNKWWNWYKNHYGIEPEGTNEPDKSGLTKEEAEEADALFNAYIDGENLLASKENQENLNKTNYENMIGEEKKAGSIARQNAEITYNRLMKYIPDMLKKAGLAGSGLAETSLIATANDYNKEINAINNEENKATESLRGELNAALQSIEENYNKNQGKLDTELAESQKEISRYYDKIAREKEDENYERFVKERDYQEDKESNSRKELASSSGALYKAIINNLFDKSGELIFGSGEKMQAYLDKNKDALADYYDVLTVIATAYRGKGANTEKKEEKTGDLESAINKCFTYEDLTSLVEKMTEEEKNAYSDAIAKRKEFLDNYYSKIDVKDVDFPVLPKERKSVF